MTDVKVVEEDHVKLKSQKILVNRNLRVLTLQVPESQPEEPVKMEGLIEMAQLQSTGIATWKEPAQQATEGRASERWSMPGAGIPDFNGKRRKGKGMAYILSMGNRLVV